MVIPQWKPTNERNENLNEQEKVEIKNIIQEKIDVKISFDAPLELGLHGIKKSFNQEIESSKR